MARSLAADIKMWRLFLTDPWPIYSSHEAGRRVWSRYGVFFGLFLFVLSVIGKPFDAIKAYGVATSSYARLSLVGIPTSREHFPYREI